MYFLSRSFPLPSPEYQDWLPGAYVLGLDPGGLVPPSTTPPMGNGDEVLSCPTSQMLGLGLGAQHPLALPAGIGHQMQFTGPGVPHRSGDLAEGEQCYNFPTAKILDLWEAPCAR